VPTLGAESQYFFPIILTSGVERFVLRSWDNVAADKSTLWLEFNNAVTCSKEWNDVNTVPLLISCVQAQFLMRPKITPCIHS
jgi:hypothetical protein